MPVVDFHPRPMPATHRSAPPPSWPQMLRAAFNGWRDDNAQSMGAALSYYTFFSLAPLLLIVVSVTGLVFGDDAARGQLGAELQELFGARAAASIQSLVATVHRPSDNWFGTGLGLGAMLIGATTVFTELQQSLDRIWRAPPPPDDGLGVWPVLRSRLLSFGVILGLAFLLMVSLLLGAVVSALNRWWSGLFGIWPLVAQALDLVIGLTLTTAVFATVFKFMPRVRIAWRDVLPGALITAILFTIGRFLISAYVARTGVESAYGAAGSIVVVLLWVYYSSQIFLLGAEFTRVYAQTRGSHAN